jgi:two-component system OmpR family sensor kinase
MANAALNDGDIIGPVLVQSDSGQYVVLYRPVADKAGTAVVQFSAPLDRQVEDLLSSFRLAFGVGLLILVGITLFLGRPLASLALRPLRRLTDTVSNISPEHLSARVPVPPAADDLHELALAFNSTLERIDRSVQAQRRVQDQLRRFLGDASHELRSPLTALIGYNELLLQNGHIADAPYIAQRMRRELERMNGLVGDLLTLTRLDGLAEETKLQVEPVDLVEVAEEVVESFSQWSAGREITLRRLASEAWVSGDREALERVAQNLVANAVQHTPDDGSIVVEVEAQRGCARLRVVDDGEGIPLEHQPRVFDRFYRVDPARARDKGNAGLGLAIVRSIVGRHRGVVSLNSVEGSGTTFTVELPLVERRAHDLARLSVL